MAPRNGFSAKDSGVWIFTIQGMGIYPISFLEVFADLPIFGETDVDETTRIHLGMDAGSELLLDVDLR